MGYSTKDYSGERMARASGRALPISTKASIEICNTIRKKKLAQAKTDLDKIISIKTPVAYSRFTNGAGHKKSIGPGKYPVKAAKEILKIVKQAEANAQFKGLNTSDLLIRTVSASKSSNVWRFGRFRRRRMKRTNIEIVVEEGKPSKKQGIRSEKAASKTAVKKETVKPAEKKETLKATTKPAPKEAVKKEKQEAKND